MRPSSLPAATATLAVVLLAATVEIQASLPTLLEARQTPATTTSTSCPDNDGLFYVSDYGYTYQLQCGTTYVGTVLEDLQTTSGFSSCIEQCADYNYNQMASSSYCLAATFNAPDDTSTGDCSLYSDILTVNVADQSGLVEDSVLLISGNGQQFALPQSVPSQVLVSSNAPTTVGTEPASVTSTAGVSSVSQSAAASLAASSAATGSPTASTSTPFSLHGGQETMTSVVPYTEVTIIPVVECYGSEMTAANESSCSTVTTQTSSVTGYRTEIACTPGTCLGVMIVTGTMPGPAETGICVVS